MSDATKTEAPVGQSGAHSGAEWRNFYGRRHGKTLRNSQKTYLSEDLETLRPAGVGRDENPERLPLDLAAIFGDAHGGGRPVWLEIGFGGGE
ncbi:MAG TPA: tRNA (guanosine(46)-N7)-methyltransferase TrmB, partial [Paracoccaceae bacterium]